MRRLSVVLLAGLVAGGCQSSDSILKKVTYGEPIDAEYQDVVERAVAVLGKEFPKGLDPDRTNERAGELWTIWHNYKHMHYRKTERARAHVFVEPTSDGKIRVGVSVVRQVNDNIENPSIISEAKWVRSHRDMETAQRIEARIAQRYLRNQPSEAWKEKHRDKPSGTLRQDIIDRNKDVDLDHYDKPDRRIGMPTATQGADFWDPKDLKKKKNPKTFKEDDDE